MINFSESVSKMLAGKGGPTAPLSDFVKAYNEDADLWWKIECGHHQNLFEAALDWIDKAREDAIETHRRCAELEKRLRVADDRLWALENLQPDV